MTVTYSLEVSEARLGGFGKLLVRWKGSIYKLVYKEMAIFLILYYVLTLVYRLGMKRADRKVFEDIVKYSREFTNLIPLTFILGFYVSLILTRWWSIYMNLPWPDRICVLVGSLVQGADSRGRLIRRSLARHLNSGAVVALRMVSSRVMKRFPTHQHLIDAGIFTEEEAKLWDEVISPHSKWWVSFSWFANLIMQARKEGRIHDDIHLQTLQNELLNYRGCCGNLLSYDWISVPLVYTQVVTIAVYSFFTVSILARQQLMVENGIPDHSHGWTYLNNNATDITQASASTGGTATSAENVSEYGYSLYFPFFMVMQFFFYGGWLKVAEAMINPLGDDDDDFDVNYLIDRNIQVSLLQVDEMYQKYPKLEQDKFWSNPEPEIPYTEASRQSKKEPFMGSTKDLAVSIPDSNWTISNPVHKKSVIPEEDEDGDEIPLDLLRDENDPDPESPTATVISQSPPQRHGSRALLRYISQRPAEALRSVFSRRSLRNNSEQSNAFNVSTSRQISSQSDGNGRNNSKYKTKRVPLKRQEETLNINKPPLSTGNSVSTLLGSPDHAVETMNIPEQAPLETSNETECEIATSETSLMHSIAE